MKEYILWVLSFITLFTSLFWLQVTYLKNKKQDENKELPEVSILIPAYNEEKTIKTTLKSILNLDYPREKLKIIVINDCSKDNTEKEVKKFKDVLLINNHITLGKAASLNIALKKFNTKYFAVLDADSEITRDSLKKIVSLFDKYTGAVISTIKIKNPKNIYHHIQRVEYLLSNFIRRLMSKIEALHITPGVLSVYRTDVIKKLKGFDENNLTEDLEIAMRLRYNHYKVKMNPESITYTNVPSTFKNLWNQRVRWFRGFIYNNMKYKKMFMSKKHGLMGTFQIPLNAITFFTIILTFFLISYEIITKLYNFIVKIIILKKDLVYVINFPSIKELLLSFDLKFYFPLIISFFLTLFLINEAHKSSKEKWLFNPALLIYFTFYPLLRLAHWITAFYKEVVKSKRKW